MMKTLKLFVIMVLGMGLIFSCTAPPSSTPNAEDMIKPGDKIGELLLTKGELRDFIFMSDMDCVCNLQDKNHSCRTEEGTNINISPVIQDKTTAGIEKKWSNAAYELYLEDHPVDLEAFGTIDFENPATHQKIRAYNVVIVDAQPGEFTVRERTTIEGKSSDCTTLITIQPLGVL